MKKFLPYLLLLLVNIAWSSPVLYFSDIVSGPKSGNTDTSLGQESGVDGCIVTVWGIGLGTSTTEGTIFCGGVEAANVYSWRNATYPADMYTFHGMQMIEFQISHLASDGAGEIYVDVNGEISNTLPFTIRSGNIYFVKTTGNDANTGTWTQPFLTLSKPAGYSNIPDGSIVYACDGIDESGNNMTINGPTINYSTRPCSMIAYPEAIVKVKSVDNAHGRYWNIAKLYVNTLASGINTTKGGRIIGNNITGPTATGSGGAINGNYSNCSGVKCFGNYIHDFGNLNTSKLHHTFYITNRSGVAQESYEIGWTYIVNSMAKYGIHVYDEGIAGDWYGVMKIHDNVVVNQRGCGIDIIQGAGPGFTMPIEIYNNILINTGLTPQGASGGSPGWALHIAGDHLYSNVKFYNNTIFGYSQKSSWDSSQPEVYQKTGNNNSPRILEYKNNIIYDTKDIAYTEWDSDQLAEVIGGNFWYNGGDTTPVSYPAWDYSTHKSSANPMFVSTTTCVLRLAEGSPAIGFGLDTTTTCPRDFWGNLRNPASVDSGAISYSTVSVVITILAPSNLVAVSSSSVSILLTWTDNSSNEDIFKIERYANTGEVFTQIGTAGQNITTYLDTGLTANTTYTYRIRGYGFSADSSYSDSTTTSTLVAQTLTPAASKYCNITEKHDRSGLYNFGRGDNFKLNFADTTQGNFTIRIFDRDGKEFVNDNYPMTLYNIYESTVTFTSSFLKTGSYRIEITNPSGEKTNKNIFVIE